MKTVNKKLSIGTGNMELYVDASIDGKEVLNKKSDSLLGQFAKMLYGCMQPQSMSMMQYRGSRSPTSITNNGTGLIQVIVSNASGFTIATGDTVVISEALGCTEAHALVLLTFTQLLSNN